MARLPTVDQLGDRPVPHGRNVIQIQRDPAAGVAGELAKPAAILADAFAKAKERDDKYRVEDGYNRLQKAMLDYSVGPDGFQQVKAGDVAGDKEFYTKQMDRLQKAYDGISDGMVNDEQKAMLARRYDVAKLGFGSKLAQHITQETSAYQGQVYKGGVQVELDAAAANYNQPNAIKQSLLRTQKLTEAELDRQGVKGDARKAALADNASNIHLKVLQTAIDSDNVEYAKDYFKKHQGDIVGTARGDMKKLLREADVRGRAQDAVDKFHAQNMSHEEALAAARKISDPKVRDDAVNRVNVRWAEDAKLLDEQQKAFGETAWSWYAEHGNIDELPAEILRGMDGKERAALQSSVAKGGKIETDLPTYYGLRHMAGADPAAFKSLNLNAFADKLDKSDFEELVKLQTEPNEITTVRTKNQIMSQGAAAIGLDPREAGKKGSSGDDVRSFYKRVDDEVAAEQVAKGRKLTGDEVQAITDRLSIDVIRKRPWFWFDKKTPAGLATVEGVPTDMIDELAGAIVKAGEVPTEANIRKLYQYMQVQK